MIGVATLIIVMSVMNGFRYDLVNRILGINSHISIYSYDSGIKNYDKLLVKIKNIDGVKSANAIVESQAMIVANSKNTGGLIKGIKLDDLKTKTLISNNITQGGIEAVKNKSSVIIGSIIAKNMNLDIGDKIKIISAQTTNTIVGAIPRIKTYKVGGVFESGMYEYDSTTIFANFNITKKHFNFRDSASGIEIFVTNMDQIEDVKRDIYEILVDNPSLYLTDWQQANASFIDALKVESTVMFLILTLIILVAAFNIISSMIMLVNDKNKNIALLRTLGMNKSNILRIFLICGSSIGVIGTFLGFVIGVLFSANINNIKIWLESITNTTLFNPAIYFLSTLPSKIFVSDVVIIVLMSLVLTILATIYPALKASRYNPAEILRYE